MKKAWSIWARTIGSKIGEELQKQSIFGGINGNTPRNTQTNVTSRPYFHDPKKTIKFKSKS